MKKFGLIGYPLSHSFSKKYFTEKFERENIKDCRYDNYPMESIGLLPAIIRNEPEMVGLNVTIPYKEKVLAFLDETDPVAREIGAVNTIKITGEEKRLKGFNTDVYGFFESIKPFLRSHHKKALILGTGGASKAVAHAFKGAGIDFTFASRTPKNPDHLAYHQITVDVMHQHLIIVNTSPLGMYPDVSSFPDIPYSFLGKEHILYDLVYNPLETIFLKKGKEKGVTILNGLNMLHLQAEKAWEIWNR